jgi:phosphonate C-P lyase system protein PhnH
MQNAEIKRLGSPKPQPSNVQVKYRGAKMRTHPTATANSPPPSLPFDHGRQPPQPENENARVFGVAWDALRFPGMRHRIPETPTEVPGLYPATVALCHALLNPRHTLWIDQLEHTLLRQWCRHRTIGRLVTNPETADFTLVTTPSRMPALYHLNIGDGSDPATATTLLIQVTAFDPKGELLWSPKDSAASHQARVEGLPSSFWRQREELQEMLPWGIDIFFIHDHSFVALPRSLPVKPPQEA